MQAELPQLAIGIRKPAMIGSRVSMKLRLLFVFLLFILSSPQVARSASATRTESFDLKEFGLLAIQDNGRRKPLDTFSRETLTRITGRSQYTDKAGRTWEPNDFVLSALLETYDWRNEPFILISIGRLIDELGLDRTQRRFYFAALAS